MPFIPLTTRWPTGSRKEHIALTNDTSQTKTAYRISELPAGRPTTFELRPDKPQMEQIAANLGLEGLRKLSFIGAISSEGKRDWRLDAKLGATVVQPCVVTLAPVTTRIDTPVERVFVTDMPDIKTTDDVEMPEDDTLEPLSDVIDLTAVMAEALALALPDYPRSEDAQLDQTEFIPDGADPIREEETKPFAGLAALKDKLDKDQ